MLAAAPVLAADEDEDSRTESAALPAEATLSAALPPSGAAGAELVGVADVDPGLGPFGSNIETKSPPAGVAEVSAVEGAASAAGTEGLAEPPEGPAGAALAVALRVGSTGALAASVGAAAVAEAELPGEAGAGDPSPAAELVESDLPAGAAASARGAGGVAGAGGAGGVAAE